MKRGDKTRAIVRYLISRTGIPLISWDGTSSRITAPPPYGFDVVTDAAGWRFFQYIRELPEGQINAVIRYDKYIDHIGDAVVGMRLSSFVTLLEAHHKNIEDRVQNYVEGE